jgi:hypothetical protein
MRVTVIPQDHWIRRDTEAANLPDWPFDDATIHAIQWYDTEGEIEYNSRPKSPNEAFADTAILEPYLTALDAHLAQQAEVVISSETNGSQE